MHRIDYRIDPSIKRQEADLCSDIRRLAGCTFYDQYFLKQDYPFI